MLEDYCSEFIEKSEQNYKLYEFLNKNNCFIEWQITAIFYSALCYAKAYLYKKGMPINSINSHDNIKFFLAAEQNMKTSNILVYYEIIYSLSRDARYKCKKMTQEKLNRALENYNKVIEILKEKYA